MKSSMSSFPGNREGKKTKHETRMKQFLQTRWHVFSRTPFGCLLRLFIARMFHGGGEPGAGELDLGIGVIVIMLAMPGVLVSLLMFEKYGSLLLFFAGP